MLLTAPSMEGGPGMGIFIKIMMRCEFFHANSV